MSNSRTQPLVLAVDDEAGILRLMNLELTMQGFKVLTCTSPLEGLKLVQEQRPDVLLVDVIMPEMTGIELMRRVRERSNVPVILVTARDKERDRVRGLELGADDYVVKPFSPEELGARIRAVLRRGQGQQEQEHIVKAANLEIDLMRRLVKKDGELVTLTRTEWQLLQFLAEHDGKVLLNGEILSKVWGPEYRDDLQFLRVWISRLRSKIEPDRSEPRIIKTLQGVGYRFEADETLKGDKDQIAEEQKQDMELQEEAALAATV